tara:strand:- start:224 stop:541 length:318 start_codon:yes stop_codon:yes gene_type:complete
VSSAADYTITCKIEGITSQATVEWTTTAGPIADKAGEYTLDTGSFESTKNTQEGTLLITATKLEALGATTEFTCTAIIGSSVSKSKVMTLNILKFGKILKYLNAF